MKETVIFIHIPRTAGTTLHNILNRNYSADENFSFDHAAQDSIAELLSKDTATLSKLKMIRGHMGYGLGEHLPCPSEYFTVLREPVDRAVSFFYYVRNNELHYLNTVINEEYKTLPEFFRHGKPNMLKMFDNAQTRLMSGEWLKPEYGACTQSMLDQAKENLVKCSAIGLTERFDESLLLFKHAFGWQHLQYEKANAAPGRPAIDKLDAEEYQAASACNQLDIELYAFAQELFDKQIQEIGPTFQEELRELRAGNCSQESLDVTRVGLKDKLKGVARRLMGR